MHDLVIIGAGPAGLTAGLYAGRFRLHTLLLEKMSPGGQIILSPRIDNFPGFPGGGIDTQELISKFTRQVEEVGVRVVPEEALQVSGLKGLGYEIRTTDATYQAKTVIIATGARPRTLGVPGEDRFLGKGTSYCGTCDGPLFKNKDIVVVGGGDRAIEDALFLATYASKVTVVHRRQELRASMILQEKAAADPKINFILDSVIEEIAGDKSIEQVRLRNVKTGQATALRCQGVFIFVGIKPHTDFVKNILKTDEAGFIITNQHAVTSSPGIFACGDCCQKGLYQVVTACAEGATAADSAHKYLLNLKDAK
ncbi:MAG TPA: thioredoxin-disulfide reductase [Patescibacteria group bacterium]|nr:thioredoxin-disulfide reductase [Patescibacteria group bacterium]